MKSLIILSGVALSLGLACGVSNNKTTQVKADGTTPTADADSLSFIETGYTALLKGQEVQIPGVSFDAETKTYTFENVNFTVNGINSRIAYEDIGPGEDATINFNLVGDNKITFFGEDDAFVTGFQLGYAGTYNFSGTGSLTVDASKLIAKDDTSSHEFASSAIWNYGTLIINEGTSLNCIGGEGSLGSYGIWNNGFLYNRGGKITATSGKSNPTQPYDYGTNGFGVGFFNEFRYDDGDTRYPGIYEQSGKGASLTAISVGESYSSYGVHCDIAEGVTGKSSFKVSGGTVKAVAKNCYDSPDAVSIGFRTTYESTVEFTDCVIDAVNECEKINPLNTKAGDYLDPKYMGLELLNSEKDIKLSGTAIINCTSPKVERSVCSWFEDTLDDIYFLQEGKEEIFVTGLESKYPEEVTITDEFEFFVETKTGKERETANFIMRPEDGTVTMVAKKEYFEATYKSGIVKEINDYKDLAKYGDYHGYGTLVTNAKKNVTDYTYNVDKLYSENKAVVDGYKASFIESATPIITFTDAQLSACDHFNTSVDVTKTEEYQLAIEYVAKVVAVDFDATKLQAGLDEINALIAEFDSKLAEMRKVTPTPPTPTPEPEPTPVVKKGLSAGAIVGIVAGSLVVVYGAGYALWKTSAFSFMTKPFFGKTFNWFDKLVSKIFKKKNK